ncbi:SGNH/GDSL hydrolase family protein [Metabacillus iocasae]|uniref:Lysophospholipase L1-like esterase n=1 Tax=Priestia iocasae TaxID=2291674 RepID=A0ABS2QW76_9BACI|nr:SGNH/GDSL hydrolase family protein [Metabacillus iocasae]MBM7703197.1 lysophospholipase L1-like esterase [Metabacillus iocasae]
MNKYKKWFVMLICVFLLSACAAPAFLAKEPTSMTEKQVELSAKQRLPKGFFPVDLNMVAIGDSLTEGVGDGTKKGGYVPHVAKYISEQRAVENVSVNNLGKRGNRTDQLLARLNEGAIAAKVQRADIIFITIGGNDMMKVVRDFFYNISLDTFKQEQVKYESRLHQVFKKVRELNNDAHIYLVGFYNPFFHSLNDVDEINTVVKEWNETSERVSSQYENVSYVKVDDIFALTKENLLAKDEFHPNKKGYKLMAERINYYVKRQEPMLTDDGSLVEEGVFFVEEEEQGNEN